MLLIAVAFTSASEDVVTCDDLKAAYQSGECCEPNTAGGTSVGASWNVLDPARMLATRIRTTRKLADWMQVPPPTNPTETAAAAYTDVFASDVHMEMAGGSELSLHPSDGTLVLTSSKTVSFDCWDVTHNASTGTAAVWCDLRPPFLTTSVSFYDRGWVREGSSDGIREILLLVKHASGDVTASKWLYDVDLVVDINHVDDFYSRSAAGTSMAFWNYFMKDKDKGSSLGGFMFPTDWETNYPVGEPNYWPMQAFFDMMTEFSHGTAMTYSINITVLPSPPPSPPPSPMTPIGSTKYLAAARALFPWYDGTIDTHVPTEYHGAFTRDGGTYTIGTAGAEYTSA
jgi:hypothetical protein